VLLRIIDRFVYHGASLNSIAAELNVANELSPNDYIRHRAGKKPRGTAWMGNNIGRILRSPSLLGQTTHQGSTVRDLEGLPILKGPPLISQELYDRLQATLEARSVVSSTRTRNTSPLLGVALCGVCESRMYHRQVHQDQYKHRYYLCRKGHPVNSIRADLLEDAVEDAFMYSIGDDNVREKYYVPAEDHQLELEEAQRAVDEITPLLGTVTSGTVRSRLLKQLEALDSRITTLEQLPTAEARWEWQERPETYAETWKLSDAEERRQLLLRSGITVVAKKGVGNTLEMDFRVPEDKRERLGGSSAKREYANDDGVIYP
jgi:hypothetical protein